MNLRPKCKGDLKDRQPREEREGNCELKGKARRKTQDEEPGKVVDEDLRRFALGDGSHGGGCRWLFGRSHSVEAREAFLRAGSIGRYGARGGTLPWGRAGRAVVGAVADGEWVDRL